MFPNYGRGPGQKRDGGMVTIAHSRENCTLSGTQDTQRHGWREETLGIFYQSWGKYVFSGVWPKRQSNEEKVVCVVIS